MASESEWEAMRAANVALREQYEACNRNYDRVLGLSVDLRRQAAALQARVDALEADNAALVARLADANRLLGRWTEWGRQLLVVLASVMERHNWRAVPLPRIGAEPRQYTIEWRGDDATLVRARAALDLAQPGSVSPTAAAAFRHAETDRDEIP